MDTFSTFLLNLLRIKWGIEFALISVLNPMREFPDHSLALLVE